MRTVLSCAVALLGVVVLLPVLLVATAFWIVSAFTRVFGRLLESAHLTRDQLIQFDPRFGWRARPNVDTYHLTADLFRIRTDAEGWRGRARLADSDVIVFGDSFAAGYAIGENEFFANLSSHPKVKTIGIGGYSMVQELMWMQELAPRLRGRLVVWFVYCGNDFFDNLQPELRGYRRPFVREARGGGWEIVSDHVRAERWPIVSRSKRGDIHMVTLAELCSDTFLAHRAYSACEFLLRQGSELCAAAGGRMVVLSIPDRHQLYEEGTDYLKSLLPEGRSFDAGLPERHLASMCQSIGVPFVRGSEFLDVSCYHTTDCHWNAQGNQKVAARLTQLYASSSKDQGLTVAASALAEPAHIAH